MKPPLARRRWLVPEVIQTSARLVPEVIQTSAMDCGPAVLACLLRGHGIPADYGRLREVCQTEVDGTSIDVLEAVACQAGLHAEQVMLPADHLLLPEAEALPAIVVTVQPGGLTHFVLLWRRHGPFVQVMDPGQGRRWLTCSGFLRELYHHSHRLPAAAWRAWAGSDGYGLPLARRLRQLGLGRSAIASRLARAREDETWRCHSLHQIRRLPALAGRFVLAGLTLAATAGAIAWFHPAAAAAFAGAALALLAPLLGSPALAALDLRLRTHAGGLTRFYLDALLGLVAVRAHGADATVRREFESLLTDWAAAARQLLRAALAVEGVQLALAASLAGLILSLHAGEAGRSARALLLAFWVLNLPLLGQEIVILVRQYPTQRNVTLRLLEPLGAAEGPPDEPAGKAPAQEAAGAAVELRGVSAAAGGRLILEGVSLSIAPGSHVAVVGPSGSGKSSLVGLLLGRHAPAAGEVLVDGEPLCGERPQRLRERTAWVDPGVRLWNQPLLDNLLYGGPQSPADLGEVLSAAELLGVLQRLPQGLQTPLGEGGGLVSGGEGQRVRLGRGLARADARLVILDEPFRGLDRPLRDELLARPRSAWSGATLLCVTHDLEQTVAFERVLVVEAGRVVEDDCPARLLERLDSHYRALLEAEGEVRKRLWNNPLWRRCVLRDGKVHEGEP